MWFLRWEVREMPLWFIKLALVFIFVIPLICLITFAIIAGMVMEHEERKKANGKAQELHA